MAALSVLAVSAQQPAQKFGTSTTAVVIDVVVRDGKGQPVTDLAAADFELYENGVRQTLGDVTRVGGPAPSAGAGHGPAAAAHVSGRATSSPTAVTAPTFLALVFDRLTPEARALAYKGALGYVATTQPNDFIGVFLSDRSLVPIQTYTSDRARIRKGIDDAARRATSIFDRDSIRATGESPAAGDFHSSVPVVASPESPGRPAEADMSARVIGGGAQTGPPSLGPAAFERASKSWERLSRDYQGYASVNALRAVIEGLSVLPGRKSVVFFAEGLALPDAVLPQFDSVVATANRANVSVYTLDAAGLRVHSTDAAVGREVRAAGTAGITLTPDGSNMSSLGMFESIGDMLRKDPRTSLTLLAERTGGFLVENSNDLAHGLRAIDADRRFHYLLTYTPTNPEFNGEWRKVEVRVPSRKVQIRSRSGYPAVRLLSSIPLLAYEGPAMMALDRTPPPADLPLRLGAFVFPAAEHKSRVALMVAAAGPTLTFEQTADGYRTDFTVLARVKDGKGEVVRKGSQPYRITGPAADRDRVQKGEVLFYRQPELPTGTYTFEAAVHDALAPRAGVLRMPLEVPAEGGLRVSSLVVVSRTERLMSSELDADNPLQVRDRLIYPALGEPLQRRRNETVAFYFVIEPAGPTPVDARLHILQGGHVVAELPVPLDALAANGRIQQVSQIPAGGLGTGDFTFRLVVKQGSETVLREVALRVEIRG